MKAEALELDGLLVLQPPIFEDSRGYFFESFNELALRRAGITSRFVQDNQSRSAAGVLRGLHAQLHKPQGKLVRVVAGEVFDVAVDLRTDSSTFGQWVGVTLSAANRRQLWVPPGFAHGFCALSDDTEMLYKCTELYDPEDEIGLRWDDPVVDIDWPINRPVLSGKDAVLPLLADLRPRLETATAYCGTASSSST